MLIPLRSMMLGVAAACTAAGSAPQAATPAVQSLSVRPEKETTGGSTAAARSSEPAPVPDADSTAGSLARLDPAPFDALLRKHVRGGRVDYRGLSADGESRARLERFLAAAASMPEEEPLSSWLNVYNALVLHWVLERYPIKSVMDVDGFFKKLTRSVAGKPRTLDAIEHGLIRKRFPDARVHMALNCGAISCPALHGRAFREQDLDATLTALSRSAMADPRHVRLVGSKLEVSALFFWFEADFARDAGSVLAWIKRYGPADVQALPDATALVQRKYDWSLAEAR